MPSVSKKQQKFMGIVRSIQKGEQPAGKFSKDAQKAAKKMKKSSVKKYAKTKHDDLPMKKESKTSNMMKAVRKGGTAGPWDIIISKNNKIVKRVSVKNLKEIPAEMDDVKKKFPNHKIGIESKYGKIVYRESYDFKKAHKKFKETGELPPHLKKLVKDLDKVKVKHKVKNIVVPGLEWMSKIKESLQEVERDYKDEYKKFQSSTKAKKYRAELNKYNRQKGTYGNGDGKDASHKGGKIVGFESQSKNRGRAEKSRLKKEDIRQEIEEYVDGILDGMGEEFMVNEEKECMCEACQKGYMTHPTRKTKVMFGKRYRNCIKAEGNVEEGKYSKIMKAVRKGPKSGPWQIIVSKNNKVVKEVPVKTLQLIPAHYDDIKKAYPNHKIGIEAKDGKIVYREWVVSIKEGTCGYGIDGQLGSEPAGPHLLKKKKKKKDEVSLGGRMAKKIGKHRGTRDKGEIAKILKLLIKRGNKKKDAMDMINKNYDRVSKAYRKASPAKKAEILSSLQEAVKLKGKSGMGTISHVGMPPASKGVEKLFKIADGGFGKVGGQTVDSMSANLFKQIYDKASDDIKLKLNKKNEKQLVMIISKMWDKFGKNVSIGSSI